MIADFDALYTLCPMLPLMPTTLEMLMIAPGNKVDNLLSIFVEILKASEIAIRTNLFSVSSFLWQQPCSAKWCPSSWCWSRSPCPDYYELSTANLERSLNFLRAINITKEDVQNPKIIHANKTHHNTSLMCLLCSLPAELIRKSTGPSLLTSWVNKGSCRIIDVSFGFEWMTVKVLYEWRPLYCLICLVVLLMIRKEFRGAN